MSLCRPQLRLRSGSHLAGNDQIQLLVRNARQILNIVTVTFGFEMFDLGSTFDQKTCSNPRDDAQELACEWHRVNDALKTMDGEAELDPAWREAMSKVCHYPDLSASTHESVLTSNSGSAELRIS